MRDFSCVAMKCEIEPKPRIVSRQENRPLRTHTHSRTDKRGMHIRGTKIKQVVFIQEFTFVLTHDEDTIAQSKASHLNPYVCTFHRIAHKTHKQATMHYGSLLTIITRTICSIKIILYTNIYTTSAIL